MKSLLSVVAVVALSAGTSQAGDCHVVGCAPCPPPACQPACVPTQPTCEWEEVERIVQVQEWDTETRKVQVTEYERQECERTVTVYDRVRHDDKVSHEVTYYVNVPKSREETITVCKPVWRDVKFKYTVCELIRDTKKCTRTVCKPVWTEVDQDCTVMVPCVEDRTDKVCVWKCVPVTRTRQVCEDQGHWEERSVQVGSCNTGCYTCNHCNTWCNTCAPVACAPVTCTQKVWVPNVVTKDVEYTVNEWQCSKEDRTYQVTVCKPVTKTRKVKVCNWTTVEEEYDYVVCRTQQVEKIGTRKVCEMVRQEQICTINYTVCVPKTKIVEETVCRWECVPTQKVIKETVCVPVTVEKEVQVPVCRWVSKTIKVKVPVYTHTHCNACTSACNTCCN
jgi:hypothetical protein